MRVDLAKTFFFHLIIGFFLQGCNLQKSTNIINAVILYVQGDWLISSGTNTSYFNPVGTVRTFIFVDSSKL